MDEFDDTPVFRERVAYLEGQIKVLKAEIKGLIAETQGYARAGVEYGEFGRAFAEKTLEFGRVIPAIEGVGQTLKGLHNLVNTVNAQVTSRLTGPLDVLLNDIKHLRITKTSLDHAEDEYYVWLSKSLSVRSDADASLQQDTDREAARKKAKFDMLRLEYLGELTDLNTRRRYELLTFFGKFIQDQVWFFSEGLKLLEQTSPAITAMMEDVEMGKTTVHQDRSEREEVKIKLLWDSHRTVEKGGGRSPQGQRVMASEILTSPRRIRNSLLP